MKKLILLLLLGTIPATLAQQKPLKSGTYAHFDTSLGAFTAQLEPKLAPGAFVAADDIHLFPDALKAYLDYVREPKNGYVSVTFPEGDAVELSVRSR